MGRKNRRDTLIVIGVAAVLLAIAILVVRLAKPAASFQRQEYVLDDYVTITVYGGDQSRLEEAVDAAFSELYRLEGIADRYKPQSELARVNDAAAAGAVAVSEDLWAMLAEGREIYESSGGLFDITVGPLIDVWGVTDRAGSGGPPPTDAEVMEAMQKVGMEKVVLDEGGHTVYLSQEGMILDLGGLAKGYAVDLAEKALRENGVESGVINMISTSRTMGEKPKGEGGPAWVIAISDPRGNGYIGTFCLSGDACVSTSGDYQRFFEYEGVRYHHIIDPRTGRPARGTMAVTVVGGRDGAWSDAMSTAAFIMGYPEGMDWVRDVGGAEALVVDSDGAIHVDPSLKGSIRDLKERVAARGD